MDFLVDTQSLVFVAENSSKLSATAAAVLMDGSSRLHVSAVVAYEYADLNKRGRFGADLPLAPLLDRLAATVIDFAADAWLLVEALPLIHRDPVDRMLIAHALHADMTIVTADKTIRSYPVRTLW